MGGARARIVAGIFAPLLCLACPSLAEQMSYQSFNGNSYTMNVWQGRNISFLTPVGQTPDPNMTLDSNTMAKILNTVDSAYDYYYLATGKKPSVYSPYYHNGRDTIADVATTCGAGCGYLGYTGIELETGTFNVLYNGVKNTNRYDQTVFYELGRNFWHYDSKLDGGPSPSIGEYSFTTGYAVFMRFKSMEYTGCAGGPFGSWSFPTFRQNVINLVDQYVADPSLNFQNTLAVGAGVPGSGLGGTDLFASFLFRLGRDYGGDSFFLNIWKEVNLRPNVSADQGAIDNFFLASCYTADHNLTNLFVNTWRWPISSQAQAEAYHIPEPATVSLLALGFALSLSKGALALLRRRRS